MQHHDPVRSPLRLMERFRPLALAEPPLWLKPTWDVASNILLPQPRPAAAAPLGRIGSLEVRLAETRKEIKRAQRLRYNVFYRDGNAIADAATLMARRDKDAFDKICEHLLVIDHAAIHPMQAKLRRKPPVVGTYRLLAQEVAAKHGGFYTDSEFDIASLLQKHPALRFLELGRSCVLPPYRTKRTVELLWHGIWSYVRQNNVDVMIGCASLEGTDPDRLAVPLSFLHHFARAPEDWRASALPQRHVEMNRLPKDRINPKAALRELPPLIKGYLRLGAFVGDGAVIDRQFGTTDVLMIMPVSAISTRYIEHFGVDATRHAA
ncbi:ornithine-acyl ACP N-acyltransferase [Afipia sp. P52-10]|uniref:GNAT family N-acetyltransferase n=1 Tax=Afipia sp. P52-10 TaxID=1429916 RepID=UPI0003DF0B94|nr:GNAT family N-acyltransferase [Afipia sp. P52-10]ETR77767.1 ornithine-acyl ACP N-acyltransferase [Afipia sp. P52-10]